MYISRERLVSGGQINSVLRIRNWDLGLYSRGIEEIVVRHTDLSDLSNAQNKTHGRAYSHFEIRQ